MSYVYSEVDATQLDPGQIADAERVRRAACERLDLTRRGIALGIRWYVRAERIPDYPLTRHGRVLDVPDDRHLSGWYRDPAWIAVRADRPRRDRNLTICHEVYHAWQEAHDQPMNEEAAEHFAQRLVAQLEGEAA